MDIVSLIISLVGGAVGGNVAGAAVPDKSLGVIGNSIAGLIGGGAGGFLMQAMGFMHQASAAGIDIPSILANVGSSGVGGAVLMVIVGVLKNMMAKPAA